MTTGALSHGAFQLPSSPCRSLRYSWGETPNSRRKTVYICSGRPKPDEAAISAIDRFGYASAIERGWPGGPANSIFKIGFTHGGRSMLRIERQRSERSGA